MNPINVLAFSGSFREKSFNTMLLNAFAKNAPGEVVVEIADFKDVPLYDQDAETNFPEAVTALKAKIEAADVILAITPEYNRGIPGVLKNMIDWTSRPWGQNSWKGKVVYVAGASMGAIGTAVAQTSLKNTFTYLDMHVIGQPEFYLGTAQEKFAEDGTLSDEDTKNHIVAAWATIVKTMQ